METRIPRILTLSAQLHRYTLQRHCHQHKTSVAHNISISLHNFLNRLSSQSSSSKMDQRDNISGASSDIKRTEKDSSGCFSINATIAKWVRKNPITVACLVSVLGLYDFIGDVYFLINLNYLIIYSYISLHTGGATEGKLVIFVLSFYIYIYTVCCH